MAGLLEGFIEQFTGANPTGEAAQQFHDRFTSTQEDDREFDNQTYHQAAADHMQQMPDDQFHDAARSAIAQAPPQQRQDLLGGLLKTLAGTGGLGALGGMMGSGGLAGGMTGSGGGAGAIGQIAQLLGLGSTDPRQMSEDDGAKLMNYARKEQPDALRQTVAEKPWIVKAMGNPIVMGALTMAAAKLLSNRRR